MESTVPAPVYTLGSSPAGWNQRLSLNFASLWGGQRSGRGCPRLHLVKLPRILPPCSRS